MKDEDVNLRAEVSQHFNGIIGHPTTSIHVKLLQKHQIQRHR